MNSDSSEGVREYSDVFNAGLQKVGKEWILEGNGLSILEETEPELEGFTHNDSEIDDFEFEDYRLRQQETIINSVESIPALGYGVPFAPFSMDLDQRFHSNALQSTNREAGYFSNEFDPTVGSPTKRFPTQPSPRSIQSNALPSPRSFYDERGKTTRVEIERSAAFGTPIRKEREFEWSDMVNKKHSIVETRYVLVENLPARTRKIDLERLIVPKFSLVLKSIHLGQLQSFGQLVLVFYDTRCIQRVIEILEREQGFGRRLVAKAISREDFWNMSPYEVAPLLSSSEGIVALSTRSQNDTSTLNDSQFPLSPEALKIHLHSFGELKSLKILRADETRNQVFVLEFYDDRVAERVFNAWNGLRIGGAEVIGIYGIEQSLGRNIEDFQVSRESTPFVNQSLNTPISNRSSYSSILSPSSSEFTPRHSSTQSSILQEISNKYTIPQFRVEFDQSELNRPYTSANTINLEYSQTIPQSTSKTVLPVLSSAPLHYSSLVQPKKKLEKNFGIYREDSMIPLQNILRLDWIESGREARTTLMMKNIPNRIDADLLARLIHEVVPNSFDFLYLRIDFSNNCNVGYGFVNFIDIESLLIWARSRIGKRWDVCNSEKVYVASYATIQGKEALITKFRNSSIMDEQVAHRPRIYYSSGRLRGQPQPFPAPDDAQKKARSVSNLQNIGLFPAQKPIFKITRVEK